jgi:glycosyltransferase involved in cell wall biosynthesis
MSPSVALVVRCFNEEAHIGRLLTGVAQQTVRPDRVLVVDSGSTDATLAIAGSFGADVATVSPERFSFGHALNVGVEQVGTDICVFASAHVYPVYDTWIERLVAPFQADSGIALTYGRQLAPPEGRFSEQQLLSHWFPPVSAPRQAHPFCNNANAAIRRSVWDEIRYDESLTGLEDLDWAKRSLEAGHHLAYVAEAPIVHVHDESFDQVRNRYRREAIAHKAIYDEQNVTWKGALKMFAVNTAGDLREARREGVLQHHVRDIFGFRAAQFLGTYQGFRQSGPVTEVLKRRFYYPTQAVAPADAPADEIGRRIDYDRRSNPR